ncbi:phosphate ABC transporter substrate-binding/OmpA family protein [Parasulfitobacter algicola]|uniref:OmpA family protein n=1 Tax=Parasulfitobacter algicola TaxID=2614809 RepID=A0ABX2IW18_9RHOB|nr:phosphate ABC transporter substrate-binding/OmpA family protein [Sulfitobacter algicola]NSX54248.1 OmpA family protein [Sulfitobacter algicola]
MIDTKKFVESSQLSEHGFGIKAVCCTALAFILAVQPAIAEVVTLTSKDKEVVMTGDLIEAEDGAYTIKTSIGNIKLNADMFDCTGPGCPDLDDDDDDDNLDLGEPTFEIAASAGIADQLLPVIVEGIAAKYQGNVVSLDSFGQALPDDIGRALPEIEDGEDEAEDSISIRILDEDDKVIRYYGIEIEEEEEAIEALSEGEVEIIFLDEPAEPDDIEEVAEGGGGTITDPGQEHVLAVEGLVVAVAPGNPLQKIKLEDIARVFSGDITNWSQLGGLNAPINVYTFDETNAAIHYVEEVVLEPVDEELGEDIIPVQTMREMTSNILSDPNGIGLVPFANKRGTRALPIESSCGMINEPSIFNIKSEEYALQRRFYAYNRRVVSPEAQEFLDYIDNREVDGLVNKAGFIDLSVIEQDQNAVTGRTQQLILSTNDAFELGILRNLLFEMQSARRLSTTFRFALGSSRLDVRSQADVKRITDYIEENRPSEIVFVGFTDSIGSFEANTNLSQSRSATVRATIQNALDPRVAANVKLTTLGYGELSPVACNEENSGRRMNRRVEVWVR